MPPGIETLMSARSSYPTLTAILCAATVLLGTVPIRVPAQDLTVYKNPQCGCCTKWVEHMRQDGFDVTVLDLSDPKTKSHAPKLPPALASCHTTVVDGYLIGGHVPADVVRRLLSERPPLRGIAVPGMPMGSPGMEGPTPQPYDILGFDDAGNTRVYERR